MSPSATRTRRVARNSALCATMCALVGVPAALHAQGATSRACETPLKISTLPARPKPGTLFVVRVDVAKSAEPITGTVAGEPLHFTRQPNGALLSFAPAPIDSTAITIHVTCTHPTIVDTTSLTISLAPATYPLERLRVAPQFSATPDSALLARQQREGAMAAAVSAESHNTPPLWTKPFAVPRPGRITSKFGGGRQFNGTVTSRHMGTDWAGATGAPIRAANRGVVRLVEQFFLGGNVVYLDHGAGLVTAYLHMSKQRVAVGDTVERGQIIGLVGATGRVTGPHLHVIARYGGVSVDPETLLRVTAAPAKRKVR